MTLEPQAFHLVGIVMGAVVRASFEMIGSVESLRSAALSFMWSPASSGMDRFILAQAPSTSSLGLVVLVIILGRLNRLCPD